ncbi:MAG: UDP-N-acetylglucosamine 4,6-dehydratase family protein [bacterium]
MKEFFRDRIVLVTGGTGTLGKHIVREVLMHDPRVVRVFSRDEAKQFDFQQEMREYMNLRFFIGDVRDKERLEHAMENVDYVFHTAAMKHVVACEYNPFEALKTNLIGSKNVIESALDARVKKVILTSTDKATNPCNTMGVSKLFAERLFTAANYYKGRHATVFSSVRFGNVLGSTGSVIPLFKKQIEAGGPVTVTEPSMTRFIITQREALNLVFKATQLAKGGEIFILKMPVICIRDLVSVMIRLFKPPRVKNIRIEYIGVQPGEKPYEELMTEEESTRAVETPDMFILLPQVPELFEKEYHYPGQKKPEVVKYISREEDALSPREIERVLRGLYGLKG